jgi:two-component sensor histidine kinase
VKNLLSIVSAIASQTFRRSDNPEASRSFSARIGALAKSQDILLSSPTNSADIAQVIHTALQPHQTDAGSLVVSGPHVTLSARRVLALSLAMHELATNATKYGALSVPAGIVAVSWTIVGDRLTLRWSEENGPAPSSSPETTGFGSRIITGNLAAEFNGTVRIEYPSTGVVCELEAPLSPSIN